MAEITAEGIAIQRSNPQSPNLSGSVKRSRATNSSKSADGRLRPGRRRSRQLVRLLRLVKRFVEAKYDAPTAKELAEEFNVNIRTVFRDLNALEEAGFRFANDSKGRRVITPEVREQIITPLFRPDQAIALLWAASLAGRRGIFALELHTASRTLTMLATDREHPISSRLDHAIMVNHCGVRSGRVDSRVLLDLLTAIIEHRKCRLQIRQGDDTRKRNIRFDPYRILSSADGIYCLGAGTRAGCLVTVPVDLIEAVKIGPTVFVPPSDAELNRRYEEAFGVEWDRPQRMVFRFHANVAKYVASRMWHTSQQLVELPNGDLDLHMRAGGETEIIRWILSWGPDVEVMKPAKLRKMVTSALMSAVERYGVSPGPTRRTE
jgi:predicted DNA-binding transcriptional regulator YafY